MVTFRRLALLAVFVMACATTVAAQDENPLDTPQAAAFRDAIFQYEFGAADTGRRMFREFMATNPSPTLAAALFQQYGDRALNLMANDRELTAQVRQFRQLVDRHRANLREAMKTQWAEEALRNAIRQYRIGQYEQAEKLLGDVAGFDLTAEEAFAIRRSVGYEAIIDLARIPPRVELTADQRAALERIAEAVATFLSHSAAHLDTIRTDPAYVRRLVGELTGGVERAGNAVRDLLLAGEFAVPALIDAIAGAPDGAAIGRYHATLATLEGNAVMPLIEALKIEQPNVRLTAAAVLGETKDLRAAAPLKALYDDPATDAGLLLVVKRALQNIGYADPEAMPPAARLLLTLAENFYYLRPVVRPVAFESVAPVWHVANGRIEYRSVPVDLYGVEYAEKFLAENAALRGFGDAHWRLLANTLQKKKLLLGDGHPGKTAALNRALAVGGLELLGEALMRPLEDGDGPLSVLTIDHLNVLVQGDPAGCHRLERLGSLEAALYSEPALTRWTAARTVAGSIAGCDFAGMRAAGRVLAMADQAIWIASTRRVALIATADAARANRLREHFAAIDTPFAVEVVVDLEDALARERRMPMPHVIVIDAGLLQGYAGRVFEAPTVAMADAGRIDTLRNAPQPMADAFVDMGVTEVGLGHAVTAAIESAAPQWVLGYSAASISQQAAEALRALAYQEPEAVAPAVPSLNLAFETVPVPTALALAGTMGHARQPSSLATLRRVAASEQAEKALRLASIRAIGNIVAARGDADGQVLADLQPLLDSPDTDLRLEAAKAIGKGGYSESVLRGLMSSQREEMTY